MGNMHADEVAGEVLRNDCLLQGLGEFVTETPDRTRRSNCILLDPLKELRIRRAQFKLLTEAHIPSLEQQLPRKLGTHVLSAKAQTGFALTPKVLARLGHYTPCKGRPAASSQPHDTATNEPERHIHLWPGL